MFGLISYMSQDWLGITILILMAMSLALLAALIISGLVYLIDTVRVVRYEGTGVVIGHEYSDESTTLMPMTAGDVNMLMPIDNPESFGLNIRTSDGHEASADVTEKLYRQLRDGSRVTFAYTIGRMTGALRIHQVYGK